MSVYTDHIGGPGTHASRPSAATTPDGALYECTTHNLIYRNNAGTWGTWAVVLPAGGTTGQVPSKNSGADGDISWGTPSAGYTDEQARDAIGAALVAGSGISITVDDAGDTITVANTGAATRAVNTQTGTSYTLVLADAGKFVTMANAGASTLTVPPNSSVAFPVGTVIEGAQLGAGQVTLTQGAGVTINATPGLKIVAQYGTFGLLKTATDTWLAFGRLSA